MNGILNWLTALGILVTLAATFAAVYFGIRGNRETKMRVSEIKNKLDRDAFIFLTEILDIIASTQQAPSKKEEIQKKINAFEKNIIDNRFIGIIDAKKYNIILELTKNYFIDFIKNGPNKNNQFKKIKKCILNIADKVDSQLKKIGLDKLDEHDSQFYWKKNIYHITPKHNNNSVKSYLIYSANDSEARIEMSKIDIVYWDSDLITIYRISPNEYETRYINPNEISIVINKNPIELTLNTPFEFNIDI